MFLFKVKLSSDLDLKLTLTDGSLGSCLSSLSTPPPPVTNRSRRPAGQATAADTLASQQVDSLCLIWKKSINIKIYQMTFH